MTKRLLMLCLGWMFTGAYLGQVFWWLTMTEAPSIGHVYGLYGCVIVGLPLVVAYMPMSAPIRGDRGLEDQPWFSREWRW